MSELTIGIICATAILMLFMLCVISQQFLVHKIVKQNKEFVEICAIQNQKHMENADNLVVTITDLKDIIVELRERDKTIRDEIRANRDELLKAYTKLLHEYESLDREFKDELKLLANKPTITNNNIPEQTTL